MTNSPRILIVDDSATTRAIIKRTIQLAGIPTDGVREAGNGRDALEKLAGQPVDLVLADLHMPEMDGEEMTRHMRQDPSLSGIPVAIISAEPNSNRIEQLKSQGARGYLRKPFTPEAVRNLVSELLGVQHA